MYKKYLEYKTESPSHLLSTVPSSHSFLHLTYIANTMRFIKAIIALSLASLALAAPSTQPRQARGQYDNNYDAGNGDINPGGVGDNNPGGVGGSNPGGVGDNNPGGVGGSNPGSVGGIIPDGQNGNRGPFDGSTSCSSPHPIEYESDHTNIGLPGTTGLGGAVNALLNGVNAGTTGQIWYAASLLFDPCR